MKVALAFQGDVESLEITEIRWGKPFRAGGQNDLAVLSGVELPREGQTVYPADARYDLVIFSKPNYRTPRTYHTRLGFFEDTMGDLSAFPISDLPK